MAKSTQEEPQRATRTFHSKYPNYTILVHADSYETLPDNRVITHGARYIIFKNGMYDPNWMDGVFNNNAAKKEKFLIEKMQSDNHIKHDVTLIDRHQIELEEDKKRKKIVEESPEMIAKNKRIEQLEKQLFEKLEAEKDAKKATKK